MFELSNPVIKLLLIPVSCGLIGYVTNVAAVKMMFYPIEFKGIRPFFGWQGIIPSNAVSLVRNTHHLIMERLVSIQDVFSGRKPSEFVAPREKELRQMAHEHLSQEAQAHMGPMWNAMSPEIQQQLGNELGDAVIQSSENLVQKVMENIGDLIDIEGMSIYSAKKDPEFMNRMFLDVGKQEFIFIERSGLYFGFLFGLGQMITWYLFPTWWVLPTFGLLVGWLTNSIAIKLIFEPRDPRRILGLKVQGLFHQRQKEVAQEFGKLVTEVVFSDERLREELSREEAKAKLMVWVGEEVDRVMAKYDSHPMRAMIPDALLEQVRGRLEGLVDEEFNREDGILGSVAAQSAPLRHEIQTRMSALDPMSFENVLRPAFQAEEWKLIAAGAALGLGAGFLQLIYLFGDVWEKI